MKRALEQDRRPEQTVKAATETEPSDDAIIERIMNGEMNAFEVLARRYERWVCGIVVARLVLSWILDKLICGNRPYLGTVSFSRNSLPFTSL